jgi:hypothetical protein
MMSNQNNQFTNSIAPDDSEIETLLGGFAPKPSVKFYSKMKEAPWVKDSSQNKGRYFLLKALSSRRILVISGIFLLIALTSILFFPSVKAVARQIIFSFLPASSDHIEIQVSLSNPGDLFHFSDPANFPFTIQEIREQAGFSVKDIIHAPEDLILIGSRFDPGYHTVTILYQGDNYKLFITQRPIGKGEDVFSIGSTAQVNLVTLGDHQAEFVTGGWKAISTQTSPASQPPGTQASINAIWDNNLPQYTLRWRDNNFVYELRAVGEGSPSQTELISLANELK